MSVRRTVVLVACSVVVLGGCSGSGDDAAPTSSTTAVTASPSVPSSRAPAPTTASERESGRPGAVVAIGDSVPAGFGLRAADYVEFLSGSGSCIRNEEIGHPALVFDALVAVGRAARSADGGLLNVACTGASTGALVSQPVDGDDPAGPSQVDLAVGADPGVVLVTTGANDVNVLLPELLIGAGGAVDEQALAVRLGDVEQSLDLVLGVLERDTAATIVVTTYHDPAAAAPIGTVNCPGACFRRASAAVIGELNDVIRAVVERFPRDRVVLADVHAAFEAARSGGSDGRSGAEPLPTVDGLGGLRAYCAADEAARDPLVNPVDCLHPSAAGAQVYADVVLEALGVEPG